MTERSRFWDGVAIGDATEAPYDAATEFAAVLRSIAGAAGVATNLGGVFDGELNELAVTGATSPVSVASGRALAYGNWYESDAVVSVAIPTPAASTRIDRIVLRKDWAAQTVRVTRIAGVEGGAAPALVQIAGTTWDTPLAQASITTGGVITLTDQREFIPRANAAAHAHSSSIDGGDGPLTIADANYYSWLTSTSPRIYRDAVDIIGLRRTTNPQGLRVYNTYTSDVNKEWVSIFWSGNVAYLATDTVGGSARVLRLSANGGGAYWQVGTADNHLEPGSNNGQDIGASSARVRTGYFGTRIHLRSGADLRLYTPDDVTDFATLQMSAGAEVLLNKLLQVTGGARIIGFTDITAGGLRVTGDATVPGASAGTLVGRLVTWGQDSAARVDHLFYTGSTQRGAFGFDSTAITIAGIAKEAVADMLFATGGTIKAFIDNSDGGALIVADKVRAANDLVFRGAASSSGILTGTLTGNRTFTFPDLSGNVYIGSTAYKTADESVSNSTTLQDEDSLQLTLPAGADGIFFWELGISSNADAGNLGHFKWGIDVPASCTLVYNAQYVQYTGVPGMLINESTEDAGHLIAAGATPPDALTTILYIHGYVVNGANAGVVKFRFAQNSASATVSAIVHKGSLGRIILQ